MQFLPNQPNTFSEQRAMLDAKVNSAGVYAMVPSSNSFHNVWGDKTKTSVWLAEWSITPGVKARIMNEYKYTHIDIL